MRFRNKHYIVENVYVFDDIFNDIRRNWEISIFDNIKNAENFQIKF